MSETKVIEGWSFKPSDLDVPNRKPGISAFMRIRNGAAFLEATIRSHIAFFDEIVAVHNQCTDATPDILARLAQEFGPKLRVYHYADRVFPPGSEGHQTTPASSPLSLVNYYNCALALTRHVHLTKLDDDHISIPQALAHTVGHIRNGHLSSGEMACFSGFNLVRMPSGALAVPVVDPVSGNGDIGFFRLNENTWFEHDRRFERFRGRGLKRTFHGFLYWHLKYLKPEFGFANYDLALNPQSRYIRKQAEFLKGKGYAMTMGEAANAIAPTLQVRLGALLSAKAKLAVRRAEEASKSHAVTVTEAFESSIDAEFIDAVRAAQFT